VKTHRRYFASFKTDWKKRMTRFEMKDGPRSHSAASHDFFDRRVKRKRVFHANEIDTAPPERFGIARYQLPVMLFAAKAKNGH
jgi:hypothetical protein